MVLIAFLLSRYILPVFIANTMGVIPFTTTIDAAFRLLFEIFFCIFAYITLFHHTTQNNTLTSFCTKASYKKTHVKRTILICAWTLIVLIIMEKYHTQLWETHFPTYLHSFLSVHVILLCFILLFAALSEELLFREYIMRKLSQYKIHYIHIIIISAVFFAIAHWPTGVPSIIFAFFGGILFGFIRIACGSVYEVSIIHILFNIITSIYMRYIDV